MFYVHKHRVSLNYGGPEEGGWWYTAGTPERDWIVLEYEDEEMAYETCRMWNEHERERREKEEDYDFSSVNAYLSNHYAYSVEDYPNPKPFPEETPYYC